MTASTLDPFEIPSADKVCPRYSTVDCANLHLSRLHLSPLSFRRESRPFRLPRCSLASYPLTSISSWKTATPGKSLVRFSMIS